MWLRPRPRSPHLPFSHLGLGTGRVQSMGKALPSTCCEDRRDEETPTLREGGSGQQPELTALWPPAPASSSAPEVHPVVEPEAQPGPTGPLTGSRAVSHRESPGASAEPRSHPEPAHPLPRLPESLTRLRRPSLAPTWGGGSCCGSIFQMRKLRRRVTRQLFKAGAGVGGRRGGTCRRPAGLRGRLSCAWGGVRFGISCCSSPLSGVGGQAVPGWEVSLEAPHPAHLVFLFPCKSDARRTWLRPCCFLPCPGSRDPLSGEILSACPRWILELAPGGTGGPGGQSRVPRIGPEGWGLPPLGPASVPSPQHRFPTRSFPLAHLPTLHSTGGVRQQKGDRKEVRTSRS